MVDRGRAGSLPRDVQGQGGPPMTGAARSFQSADEMRQNAAAVRNRLMNPANAFRPVKPEVRRDAQSIVVLYRDENPKDAHIHAWAAWKFDQGMRCKAYMRRRCEELGITYEDLIGLRRYHPLVDHRQLIMWEIKTWVKPSITWPELGRLFGGRDHTTGLHAVRKVDRLKAE